MPGTIHNDYIKGNCLHGGFQYYDNSYQYSGFHWMPLVSIQAWGSIAKKVVFQRLYGKTVAKKYDYSHVRGKNKSKQPTDLQNIYFNRFKNAVLGWQNLSQSKKDEWNTKAARARVVMSGYNYYLSAYMNQTI
jgi:hypothetical protein